MKKLLIVLLPILTLSLASCKATTPLRNSGDIYDITNYDTHVYCTLTNTCTHCESWDSLSEEKLHKAKSITCTNLTSDSYSPHYHYCITWVK